MNALLKHTLASSSKNKTQAVVIIFTLIIITVMIFAAFSLSDIFYTINMSEYDRVAQGADMLLGANFGDGEIFSRSRVESLLEEDDIESVEYFVKMGTIMKTKDISRTVLVEATDLYDYLEGQNLRYVEKYEGEDYHGHHPGADIGLEFPPVIVGERFAKESGIKIGDTIEVYLASFDSYAKLSVVYIAVNEGIFGSPSGINLLTDFSSVGNLGQVNAVYINFTSEELFEKYEAKFGEHLPSIGCAEGNNETEVKNIVASNTRLLIVGLIFIIATMILIQMTAYLIIARNRMSEMIIFKASGATPSQTMAIMLLEVFFYAFIGTVIGLFAGRLIMEIAIIKLVPSIHSTINYDIWKWVASMGIGFVVTIIAALAPIINASHRSIRDLSSSANKEAKKENGWLLVASTVLLIAGSFLLRFLSGIGVIVVSGVLVVIIAVWVSYVAPYIVKFVSYLMSKTKKGGGIELSSITVKRNRGLHTIIVLLAVVIAFSFMIVEVVGMVKLAITPFRTRYDAGYVVVVNENLSLEELSRLNNEIEKIDGIKSAGYFNSVNFFFNGENKDTFSIYGMYDTSTLLQSTKGVSDEAIELWKKTDNPLILSQDMMLRLKIKVGDIVSFQTVSPDFSHIDFTYTIVGVDETITEYDRVGYTKYNVLYPIEKNSIFLVKGEGGVKAGRDETFIELRELVEQVSLEGKTLTKSYALTFEDWAYSGRNNLQGVASLLTLFQYAIFIISLLGVINISIVTVFDRRHELLLYRLSGMGDSLSFALGEGIIIAVSGGIMGVVLGFVINQLLPIMSILVDKYMVFGWFPLSSLIVAVAGGGIFIAIWLMIAHFRNKNASFTINERLN